MSTFAVGSKAVLNKLYGYRLEGFTNHTSHTNDRPMLKFLLEVEVPIAFKSIDSVKNLLRPEPVVNLLQNTIPI